MEDKVFEKKIENSAVATQWNKKHEKYENMKEMIVIVTALHVLACRHKSA